MTLITLTITLDRPLGGRYASRTRLNPHHTTIGNESHTPLEQEAPPPPFSLSFFLDPASSEPPRDAILAFLATAGYVARDGLPTLVGHLGESNDLQDLLNNASTALNLPITMVLAHHRPDAQPDGTWTLDGNRIIGTSIVAGEWDTTSFFAPATHKLPRHGNHTRLPDLFALGAVAVAFGLLDTWIAQRNADAQPFTITTTPWLGWEERVTTTIRQILDTSGLDGWSDPTIQRDDSLKPYQGPLARNLQVRSRITSPSGRASLAEDLCACLLYNLLTLHAWVPTPLPCPHQWVASPTHTKLVDRLPSFGAKRAYAAGQALGREAPYDAPIGAFTAAGRRLDLW